MTKRLTDAAKTERRIRAKLERDGCTLPNIVPTCPSCGHWVRFDARTCGHCGRDLGKFGEN
jgi:ribosomal protein L32